MRLSRPALVVISSVAVLYMVSMLYVLGYRWVNTPSIPMGLYFTSSPDVLRRGGYACLLAAGDSAPVVLRNAVNDGLLPSEWKHKSLMKRVLGIAGDVVTHEPGRGISINGELVPDSVRLESDRYGNPLPLPTFPVTLQSGEVWLGSGHARGFDSRYFGAVRVEAVDCRGERVWTF